MLISATGYISHAPATVQYRLLSNLKPKIFYRRILTMYRSIVLLAMCLFPIAGALPRFHIAVPHFPSNDPSLQQILYDCSTECTGNRKAAEVLMTDDDKQDFPSPLSMKPYCEHSPCIDGCVLPKTTTSPMLVANSDVARTVCTSEDYDKSYECLNQHVFTTIDQCGNTAVTSYDYCKILLDALKCVVDGLTEKCGEPGGRAFEQIFGDGYIKRHGCKKPE